MTALRANMAPLGTLGSIILEDDYTFTRHRVAWLMAAVFLVSITMSSLRTLHPYVKEKWPMPMKHTAGDVKKLWATFVVCSIMYMSKVSNTDPRFPENHFLQYRFSYYFGAIVLYTAIYKFSLKYIVHNLAAEHRNQQAANIVRVICKLSAFAIWACSGDFYLTATLHPLELTDEIYWTSYLAMFIVTSLYTWEVMFRALMPVNVAHHAIACMGAASTFEWASVIEPCRTITAMPLMGSCIEGFCCIGTMCYRFLPRGKLLKRIMTAEFIFVVVAYNLLLAGYISVLVGYNDLFSFGWGNICMPCLAIFTYPAQMNMARIFWDLRSKADRPEEETSPVFAKGKEGSPSFRAERVVRRRA
eukprot:TRINITY_DN34565_c0_g1_i1.p2 TRINITY_DN34565_c0_g1~~TRINITY_DN34565_c0_g1_i1.p2  ORF type:complete len:359 (+),score=83.17 TRINITY_DN34565_c0_g1_i1:55-1131(+)